MRLVLLRQHPVFGLEVMPGMGDELRVARMIDGFDAGNDFHQPGSVPVDMLDQLVFGVARPGNQDSAGIGDRPDGGLKEVVILRGVPAADGIRLMVDVPGRVIRVQYQPLDIRGTEMEDPGFMVIDPYDRMKMAGSHGKRVLGPQSLLTAGNEILQDAAAGTSTIVLVLSTLS
jgi:hypothetical protein